MEWWMAREGGVRMMTDEQIEVLRKQIAAFATISEQLLEMHEACSKQQDAIAGMGLGDCDSLMVPGVHKIAARQRWTPTLLQLQTLESIYSQGNGVTPSKEDIKEIVLELSHHGQISDANVSNWFQNRRARAKRKQAEVGDESSSNEKLRFEHKRSLRSAPMRITDDPPPSIADRSPETLNFSAEHTMMRGVYTPNDSLQSSGNSGQLFFDDIL